MGRYLFHNGEELKASDVVFSLDLAVRGEGTQQAGNLESILADQLEAVDDYTVKVPLKVDDSTTMSNLTAIFIVNKKAYTEMGEEYQFKPVGTGPFKFKEWVVGDHVTLERFDDYFKGTPRLKSVTFRTIPEISQAMVELETGGIDIMINPLGADIVRVLNGDVKGVKAITEATCVLRNNNLNINWLSEPMKNPKVREAMAHAIDRETWTKIISPGNGIPAYSMVASGVWGYDPSIAENYPYEYNLEKAKALLTEAGYPDGFKAVLLTDARPYHQAAVELILNTFAQIGITVEVKTMELAQQKEIMVTGEGFDLFMLDNVTVGNPSNFLASLWRDSHPRFATINSSHYHFYTVNDAQGQKYSDLLDEIRVTMDDSARLELAKELQKVFVEDIVWIPINSIQGYFLGVENLQETGFMGDRLIITYLTYFN
jgi:peptide/nickel transport system substrate-binding protein